MVPYPGRRGEFRLKTAVKAIEQAGMHVETGRSVVPAEAGTHIRACSSGRNGFPPARE